MTEAIAYVALFGLMGIFWALVLGAIDADKRDR